MNPAPTTPPGTVEKHLDVPVADVDFQDPGFTADPYPVLRELQDRGPLFWHPGSGQYLVTRYREVARVLGNPDSFGSDHDYFDRLFGGRTMEGMDRPRHDEVRSVWAPHFQRDTLERLREQVSETVAGQLEPFVARLRAGETVDSVAGLTRSIPTLVIAGLLAIPKERVAQFSAWSDAMGGMAEGFSRDDDTGRRLLADGERACAELNAFIRGELAARRSGAGTDLISTMVHHDVAASMAEAEIVASNTQLVFAGNETTAKLMSHVLIALARHPEQRAELAADRSLIPAAIEEIPRWSSVVHRARRITRGGAAAIAGVPLPDGVSVTCLQGVANRDPLRWDDPDRLDIHRPVKQHLGFGYGLHSCLGLNLSRLEVQVWLDQWLDALPEWQVAGPVDWGTGWVLRGPLSLPLAAGAAADE